MSPSATLAKQNGGRCFQMPRVPHKPPRRQWRQTETKRAPRASPVPQVPRLPRKVKVDVAKWPAIQSGSRYCQVPRLPTNGNQARHQSQPSAIISVTHATQSEGRNGGRCFQMPHLPDKQPRRPRRQTGTKRATRATPAAQSEGRCCQVPRLPCKVKVCVYERVVCEGVVFM